jgi:hypothetical protein
MANLAELDARNAVDIDLGGSAFKQNARSILADWARRPPFYVLGRGPPQVVCGRYADVQEVFSDTERFSSEMPRGPGFEQFDKFMGVQFITQMDGERHACCCRRFRHAASLGSKPASPKSSRECSTASRPAATHSTAWPTTALISLSARC